MKLTERLDAAQRRHIPLSIALATVKKFSEDQSTNLATMIAFWAFFSIFPLLLVAVTVLGWVLSNSDKLSVLSKLANMFPLLDPNTITGLTGSWWPVLLGALTALWSGLAVVGALQTAFNSVWEIPYHRRPGKLKQVLRSLWVLATVGVGLVATTLLSSFITSSANGVHLGVAGHIAGYVIAVLLDVALVVAAFWILTDRDVSVRDVLPGGVFAGVIFFILQELSAFIISRHLKSAQSTYGHFATVITILWWFYLQSEVTLLGAQLNVVLKERLYPRSLTGPPRTEADRRLLQAYAAERTYRPEEVVRTEFPGEAEAAGRSPGVG
ncbi:MAG: YihY/virulence factor BrkB family protein [Solirubrobacterales bacterium]|nr:YihY/virulence factor BrkB family protein [Solirubrobacterales bacterium]